MYELNSCDLFGRVVNTPQLRQTASGVPVLNLTLQVKTTMGRTLRTDTIPVTLWRGIAEEASKNVYRNMSVLVRGRLQLRTVVRTLGSESSGEVFTYPEEVPEIVIDDPSAHKILWGVG